MKEKFRRSGKYHVYILECADGTYYTGYTSDLEHRIKLHNQGHGANYLKGKLPARLAYAKEYRYYRNALHAERNLKQLTRSQKEELVKIYEQNHL